MGLARAQGHYVERLNRMAQVPPTGDDPFIALTAHMASILATAADAGHVSIDVHKQLEPLVTNTEKAMGI